MWGPYNDGTWVALYVLYIIYINILYWHIGYDILGRASRTPCSLQAQRVPSMLREKDWKEYWYRIVSSAVDSDGTKSNHSNANGCGT